MRENSEKTAAGSPEVETRTAILDATIGQIAVNGYEAVRLRDIADAAGVSIGLLQHHFRTRDELVGEAFAYHCAELLRGWEELADPVDADPWARLLDLVGRLAESQPPAERATIWVDFCSSAARQPELRPHLRRVYDQWRSLLAETIREGTARGAFQPRLPADQVVDLLITQIDGALLAIAGDIGYMDGERLRKLMSASASLLLGHESGGKA